jgi:hypothetical protein
MTEIEELKNEVDYWQKKAEVNRFNWQLNKEQLTKAKEIIRDLLGCLYSVEYDRVSDLEQAEQFLKDCEVEK